jgi:DNA-binding LytR/AlgR family response regulator
MTTKILIIGKKTLIDELIGKELKTLGYEVFASVLNTEKTLDILQKENPDVLLMDIQTENGDDTLESIALAKQLSNEYELPVVIIGESKYFNLINSTSDLSNMFYLHKPFTINDLSFYVTLSLKNFVVYHNNTLRQYTDRFLIRDNGELVCLHVSNILWIKSRRGIIQLQLSNGKSHTLTMTLSKFIRQFQHPELLRIHSSHIINLRYLEKIIRNTAYLNGEPFKIGEVHSKILKQLFTTIKT